MSDVAVPDRASRTYLAPLTLVGVALLAVAYFDLQTNLPLLDEWARRWTVARFVAGRGLVLSGQSPNLLQGAAMSVLAYLHTEPRVWRLTVLPFVVTNAAFTYLVARRLRVDRFWSSVAAAAAVTSPLFLNLATGVMTEIAYTGLFMGALYFSLRWALDSKYAPWCTVFAVGAILQRQQGALIPVGVVIGLALASRHRPITRKDVINGVVLLAATAAVAGVVTVSKLGRSAVSPAGLPAEPSSGTVIALKTFIYLPAMAGLVTLPFLVAAWTRPLRELVPRRRIDLIPVGFGVAAVSASGMLALVYGLSIFAGPIFTRTALGLPVNVVGQKPAVYALPLFLLLEAGVVATVAMLFFWRRRSWRAHQLGLGRGMLVVQAALQILPILVYQQLIDRYYLEVVAPLLPVVASVLVVPSSRAVAARAWALAALAFSIGLYAIGEQDYISWQVARDHAARQAYAQVGPSNVEAGFEEDAENVWLPAADSPNQGLPLLVHNPPQLRLAFGNTNDKRPGFTYNSAAPGKVIIEPGTP